MHPRWVITSSIHTHITTRITTHFRHDVASGTTIVYVGALGKLLTPIRDECNGDGGCRSLTPLIRCVGWPFWSKTNTGRSRSAKVVLDPSDHNTVFVYAVLGVAMVQLWPSWLQACKPTLSRRCIVCVSMWKFPRVSWKTNGSSCACCRICGVVGNCARV